MFFYSSFRFWWNIYTNVAIVWSTHCLYALILLNNDGSTTPAAASHLCTLAIPTKTSSPRMSATAAPPISLTQKSDLIRSSSAQNCCKTEIWLLLVVAHLALLVTLKKAASRSVEEEYEFSWCQWLYKFQVYLDLYCREILQILRLLFVHVHKAHRHSLLAFE